MNFSITQDEANRLEAVSSQLNLVAGLLTTPGASDAHFTPSNMFAFLGAQADAISSTLKSIDERDDLERAAPKRLMDQPRAAASGRDAAQQIGACSSKLVAEIGRVRALVVALRLAANADEGGGQQVLYWPDLMAMIESKLPSEDEIDQSMRALAEGLEAVAEGTAKPAASAPVRVRRPLAAPSVKVAEVQQ